MTASARTTTGRRNGTQGIQNTKRNVQSWCFCSLELQHAIKPHLIHLADQGIDLLLAIAQVTALHEMFELSGPEPAVWVAQLERPEEIARLLEVRAHSVDLMNQVLHAHDAVLAQMVLDNLVVGEGDALLVDLAVAPLVDQFADGLEGGVAVGNVRFNNLKHFRGGLCEADEDAIVDLKEAEEL